MSNQLHRTLNEALDKAPAEPDYAHYEIDPTGSVEEKQRQIRAVIEQAKARGRLVEVYATAETLRACGLAAAHDIAGAPIHHGPADGIGCVRFKFARPAARGAP